jgi:hypothetical protein
MKTYPVLLALLGLFASAASAAPAPTGSPAARELAVVVVDSLEDTHGAITAFDRIDIAFHDVAEKRKWPVKIVAERFAANTPTHDTELRVYYKGIHADNPLELVFRAWITYSDSNTQKDFGVVTFRYHPHATETQEDVFEHVFRGAANAMADKIEPLLFPKPAAAKP